MPVRVHRPLSQQDDGGVAGFLTLRRGIFSLEKNGDLPRPSPFPPNPTPGPSSPSWVSDLPWDHPLSHLHWPKAH